MPRNKPMSPTQAEFLDVLAMRSLYTLTVEVLTKRNGNLRRTLNTCVAKGWVRHTDDAYELTETGRDALRMYRGIKS